MCKNRQCATCAKHRPVFRSPRHGMRTDRHTTECRKCWKATMDRMAALRMALLARPLAA